MAGLSATARDRAHPDPVRGRAWGRGVGRMSRAALHRSAIGRQLVCLKSAYKSELGMYLYDCIAPRVFVLFVKVNSGESHDLKCSCLNVSWWCTCIFVCRRWIAKTACASHSTGGSRSSVCAQCLAPSPSGSPTPVAHAAWSSGSRPQWRCCTDGTLGWIWREGEVSASRARWSLPSLPAHLHTCTPWATQRLSEPHIPPWRCNWLNCGRD